MEIQKNFADSIDSSPSILKFRIASNTDVPNTVPVNVLNQSIPVFVFPDIYLDSRHIASSKVIEGNASSPNSVVIKFNFDGCARINALVDDLNITIVMFIDNYPIENIHITQRTNDAELVLSCFPTSEQAEYFHNEINK